MMTVRLAILMMTCDYPQYLANAEEEVMDSDLSYEFHRESHHIHSIPRPRICQVTMSKVVRW